MCDAMRAVVYASVSKEAETSLQEQIEACRKYAEEQGWNVVSTAKDNKADESAIDRPGFRDMLNTTGEFDVLTLYKADRLAAEITDQRILESVLKGFGIRVEYAHDDSTEARLAQNLLVTLTEDEQAQDAYRDQLGGD